MIKPKVLVFAGYGLNCEEEVAFAFNLAGANSDIVHINDLIANREILGKYQMLAFPGGFSYGDDTGSGNAYASKLTNHMGHELFNFIRRDRLAIGICNGFQILVALGLLPALRAAYGTRQVALLHNESARYTVRWTDLAIDSNTPWLKGIRNLSLPIAHGEGKFYANAKTLAELKRKNLIAMRYAQGDMYTYAGLPVNPTGTMDDIAGITDESGRVLGIMPHPERAMFFTQLPNWTLLKEEFVRAGKPLPVEGPGLALFKNAVSYFK